jgi:N-acylmannosamine kinase
VATEPTLTALDLGGTKIAAARVRGGRVLERRRVATPRDGSPDRLLDALAGLVAGWVDGPIGLAATGLVEAGRLIPINRDTLPIAPDFAIEAGLAGRLGAPVVAVNDAQAAAWGEFRHGAGRGARSLVFVTVSTGVGGGLVLDGVLRRGLAGHVGHVVAWPDGPPCGCGRRGCLEAVASGRALTEAAGRRFGRPVSAPDLFMLAESDPDAALLLDQAAAAIGRALADLRATLDIERAVIGGGVGLARGFRPRIEAALAREPARFRCPVTAASLGHDAGLVGAADLARAEAIRSGAAP